jgi:hypothetical protein
VVQAHPEEVSFFAFRLFLLTKRINEIQPIVVDNSVENLGQINWAPTSRRIYRRLQLA